MGLPAWSAAGRFRSLLDTIAAELMAKIESEPDIDRYNEWLRIMQLDAPQSVHEERTAGAGDEGEMIRLISVALAR